MVKLKHQEENEQKCLAEAQAKKDTAKVAKYQSKLAAIGKTHADRDKILSLKLDRIKEMRADDKIDALNDTDQIKALQEDIKAQWQSTK
jgi:hypothetical protein